MIEKMTGGGRCSFPGCEDESRYVAIAGTPEFYAYRRARNLSHLTLLYEACGRVHYELLKQRLREELLDSSPPKESPAEVPGGEAKARRMTIGRYWKLREKILFDFFANTFTRVSFGDPDGTTLMVLNVLGDLRDTMANLNGLNKKLQDERAAPVVAEVDRVRAHTLLRSMGYSCVNTACGDFGQTHWRICDAATKALAYARLGGEVTS